MYDVEAPTSRQLFGISWPFHGSHFVDGAVAVAFVAMLAFGTMTAIEAALSAFAISAVLFALIARHSIRATRDARDDFARTIEKKDAQIAKYAAALTRNDMQRVVLGQHAAVSETDA